MLQQVTGINVFLYFGATIFKTTSAKTGVDAGLLTQIVINGACMPFTVIAIATVDKWGRRPLMLVGSVGMGGRLVAMGLMAQVLDDPTAASQWMLVFTLLYSAAFGLFVGPLTWVILSEIFPTAVRGRALGLATFFLWTSNYAVTQIFPMMDAKGSWFVQHFNHAFPFYVYAAFCAVLWMVVWRSAAAGRAWATTWSSRSSRPRRPEPPRGSSRPSRWVTGRPPADSRPPLPMGRAWPL